MKKKKKRPGQFGAEMAEIIPWQNFLKMKAATRQRRLQEAILVVDCRESLTDQPYDRVITQLAATVPDLHPNQESRRELQNLKTFLKQGRRHGAFSDRTKFRIGCGRLNNVLTLADDNCRPLILVTVRARIEIQSVADCLAREKIVPVAAFIGGSPLMLDEVAGERWIFLTIGIINRFLERGVPVLGICFGGQLLAYMEFGALPKYHCVPPGVNYEHLRQLDLYVPVTPGARRPIYGSRPIEVLPGRDAQHAIMSGLPRLEVLMAHGMGYELSDGNIPFDRVLAVSRHSFVDKPEKPTLAVNQEIVEVAISRSAVMSFCHPELSPDLLKALIRLIAYFREWLEENGLDISTVLKELDTHPVGEPVAGEQILWNFFLRIVGPHHIGRLVDTGRIDPVTGRRLLQCLQEVRVNGG